MRPLPAPSRKIIMKIPHATANPVRVVRSLLRFEEDHISLSNSIKNIISRNPLIPSGGRSCLLHYI